jgi:hypothetical protein
MRGNELGEVPLDDRNKLRWEGGWCGSHARLGP